MGQAQYRQARRGERHLFIGAKGSGKSAIFRMLGEELTGQRQILVRISPAEFEFPRLAAVFDEYFSEARWEFVYGSFWRFIFLTEILRAAREDFLDFLLQESGRMDRSGTEEEYAKRLVEWLRANGDVLDLDFASRVRWTIGRLGEIGGTAVERLEACEALLQHARLYEIERHLRTLATKYEIWFLIDDLDRTWSPENSASEHLLISMLNELHRIQEAFDGNLQAVTCLRRDVFRWLRINDAEILRRDPTELDWTDAALEELIAQRLSAGGGIPSGLRPIDLWLQYFPAYVDDQTILDFVLSRTHRRARDVILFCREALALAQAANRQVNTSDLEAAWATTGGYVLAQIGLEREFSHPGAAGLGNDLAWQAR